MSRMGGGYEVTITPSEINYIGYTGLMHEVTHVMLCEYCHALTYETSPIKNNWLWFDEASATALSHLITSDKASYGGLLDQLYDHWNSGDEILYDEAVNNTPLKDEDRVGYVYYWFDSALFLYTRAVAPDGKQKLQNFYKSIAEYSGTLTRDIVLNEFEKAFTKSLKEYYDEFVVSLEGDKDAFKNIILDSFVEPECTKDFVMGAITFSFYDSGKMSTLKNNCFNWLKIGISESLLAYDSDDNGKRDVIDWLDLAKYAGGWDKNYALLLGFVESYKDRENDLYTLTKEAVQDIVDNGYEIGIYEIGNELDMEFAGLNPWKPPYNIHDLNPDDWQEYWDDLAPILKAAIRGIRETDPDAKILLHLAHSHEPDFVDAFISNMKSRDVYFDYVGLTTPADFSFICDTSTLEVTAEKIGNHGKKAIIVEWAYPNDIDAAYTLNCLFDWVLDPETAASRGYPYTDVGQAACIRDELQYFYDNPNILGGMYGFPLDENAHEGLCIEKCEGRTDCNKPLILKEPALNEVKSFMSS